MNRLLFILFFLALGFSAVRAQNDIYVPCRSGKLWGISDYAGKIIIEPRYDSIVPDKSNFIFLKTFKEGKQGLVINGREILPNNYDEIAPIEEMYISALSAQGTIILDFYGNPINTKPARTITCYRLNNEGLRALIFHTLYYDNKEDLIAWDLSKRQRHYLFQNYASIKFKKPYADISKLDLRFRKNETDLIKEETYTLENFKLKMMVPKAKNETIKEVRNGDPYASYEPGLTNLPAGTGKPPRATTHETEKRGPAILQAQYWLRNDSVFLSIHRARHSNKQVTTQWVSLPKQATDIQINSYRGFIDVSKNEDTSIRYSDYITFNLQEKKGLKTVSNEVLLFDALVPVFYLNHQTRNNDVAFLGGNYEPKSGSIKYGILNARMEQVFPILFDTIIVNANTSSKDFNYWTVVQNDRFGIIHPNGTTVVEPVYDSITHKVMGQWQGDFLEIKDKHKYGVYKGAQGMQSLFVKPVFDYPVKNVYLKYPFIEYNQSRPYEKEFDAIGQKAIIVLEDKHKKIVGYANAEGRLYFND